MTSITNFTITAGYNSLSTVHLHFNRYPPNHTQLRQMERWSRQILHPPRTEQTWSLSLDIRQRFNGFFGFFFRPGAVLEKRPRMVWSTNSTRLEETQTQIKFDRACLCGLGTCTSRSLTKRKIDQFWSQPMNETRAKWFFVEIHSFLWNFFFFFLLLLDASEMVLPMGISQKDSESV